MKKNHKMIAKLVSMLLLIAMLVLTTQTTAIALADASGTVPPSVEAVESAEQGNETDQQIQELQTLQDDQASQESIGEVSPEAGLDTDVYEVVEYRDANVKHFYMGDGTYQALTYPEAVHRKDANGVWQDINNDLALSPADVNYYTTWDARVQFAKNPATAQYLTRICENGYEMSTVLVGLGGGDNHISAGNLTLNRYSVASVENPVRETVLSTDSNEVKFEKLSVINNTSCVSYVNLFTGIDIKYSLIGNTVKEDIILNEPIGRNTFVFRIDLAGLVPTLETSGRITLTDEETGEAVYVMEAPYMIDAVGAYSMDVHYELESVGNGTYLLAMIANEAWLEDSTRAYPVVIDPTITSGSNCYDTYVSAAHPTVNFGTQPEAYVSMFEYTYIQIVHPTLPEGATMTIATLWLYYYYREVGDMQIGLCMLLEPFNETTLTYNSAIQLPEMGMLVPPFATKTLPHNTAYSHENPGKAGFDVYRLLEMWYEGWGYYGLVIRREAGSARIAFKTYETSNKQCAIYAIEYHMNNYPVQDGTYYIRNVNSSSYMQLDEQYWPPTEENIPINLQPFDGAENQKWTFEYLHNGYYKITSARSGKVLAIADNKQEQTGAVPLQQDYRFAVRHEWKITLVQDGFSYRYMIQPRLRERSADEAPAPVLYLNATNAQTVVQDTDSTNALWYITTRTTVKTSDTQDIISITLNVQYDEAYGDKYSDAVSRINNALEELFDFYYFNFSIYIDYLVKEECFTSYADQCPNYGSVVENGVTRYRCLCSSNCEKIEPLLLLSRNFYHHTNGYNIAYFSPSKEGADYFVGFIGRNMCGTTSSINSEHTYVKGNNVIESKDTDAACQHKMFISDHDDGIDHEINTLIHEVGHDLGIMDHYAGTINYDNPKYSADCLYGVNKEEDNVQNNRIICSGCNADLLAHRSTLSQGEDE